MRSPEAFMQGNLQEQEPKRNGLLERWKKWGKIGSVIAVSFVAAESGRQFVESNRAYDEYLDESHTSEELKEVEELGQELEDALGDDAVSKIRSGDRAAFFERREAPVPPQVAGFEDAGVDPAHIEALIDPKSGVFPGSFVNGEVASIVYEDEAARTRIGDEALSSFDPTRTLRFFQRPGREIPQDLTSGFIPYFKDAIAHELGHGNDWETDQDIRLLERMRLLSSVLERMNAPDAYHESVAYYEAHEDKEDGAKEYWAQIVGQYFGDPQYMQDNFPNDYALVDSFIKAQEPGFDVHAMNNSVYDSRSGEVLQRWSDLFK